nr:myoneurin-like [Aedes albopictus]
MSKNKEVSVLLTVEPENPFECADIKDEPPDDLIPEPDASFLHHHPNRSNTAEVAVQTNRRKIMSRGIQVDLQLIPKEALGNVQSGSFVEEPLGPLLAKEAFEKQCRICLRQMPSASLAYIMFAQKTKILAALGIKVYLGDTYPFICRTCAKLVDMIYDFRNTCLRARNMLASERKGIPGKDWDSEGNLRLIESCQILLDSHRNDIDAAYEESSSFCKGKTKQDDVQVKPDSIAMVMVDHVDAPPEPPTSEVDCVSPEVDEPSSSSRVFALKVEPVQSDPGSDSPVENHGDDTEDEDYVPPSGEEPEEKFVPSPSPPPKKKRIRIVTKPYKKRQKKDKPPKKCDELALEDAQQDETKEDKKEKDQKRSRRGALCDFCGEWVEYHTVESHQNQHLGLKPYACQMVDCNMSFYCRNLLMKHIRRQHNADGPEYQYCDICKQRIKGPKAALTKHQKIHTEEKHYVCLVCGKGFTTPGYLRQHSNIHTDLMPYECSVCRRKFNNKYNMLTHEKKHFARGESMGAGNVVSTSPQPEANLSSAEMSHFQGYPVS